MAVPETRPNHTIYINNLNEKIKKDGEFLRESRLHAVPYKLATSFPQRSPGQNVDTSAFARAASSGFNTLPVHFMFYPLT